jgi:hypothetical protein
MDGTMLQGLLEPDAAHAVKNLLPHEVDGDLSALCVWPDQVRHWYRYRWTSPLHFIDTPDKACSFVYSSRLIHTHFFFTKTKILLCVSVFSHTCRSRDAAWPGDCHGPDGAEDMCVAGAISNFTSQLMHYKHGSADRRCK